MAPCSRARRSSLEDEEDDQTKEKKQLLEKKILLSDCFMKCELKVRWHHCDVDEFQTQVHRLLSWFVLLKTPGTHLTYSYLSTWAVNHLNTLFAVTDRSTPSATDSRSAAPHSLRALTLEHFKCLCRPCPLLTDQSSFPQINFLLDSAKSTFILFISEAVVSPFYCFSLWE